MWTWLTLIATAASPMPDDGVIRQGVRYGPSQLLICEWFSNFENSRLDRCRTASGAIVLAEAASIECAARLCDELDARARRVAKWTRADPVWGTFTVRFHGRISPDRHARRYIGDGTRWVLLERLVDIRKR